jgi:intergrase/recombinase
VYEAYNGYGNILHYYAMKNLIDWKEANPEKSLSDMHNELRGKRQTEWTNLGGQIMQLKDLDQLRADIGSGKLDSWKNIHRRYDRLWEKYRSDKQKHSYALLCELNDTDQLTGEQWSAALRKVVSIQEYISEQVYVSRKKDYDNPYRAITFRNSNEMKASIGTVEENSFILQVRQETDELKERIKKLVH